MKLPGQCTKLTQKSGQPTTVPEMFTYRDDEGNVLYTICVKDGTARKRVLYGLEQLAEANPLESLYLTKWEQDAKALVSRGLVAVADPGRATFAPLAARNVVIVCDQSARPWARNVASSLQGLAARVKILTPPNLGSGSNIEDWFESGGTLDQLRETEILTPEYRLENDSALYTDRVWAERKLIFQTAAEIANGTSQNVDWIAYPWVAAGSMTEVVGKIKTAGKTTWVTHMVRAVLDGIPFMGGRTNQTPVVYLTEQQAPSFRQALGRADLLHREDLYVLSWNRAFGSSWDEVIAESTAKSREVGSRLLVIDTFPQFAQLAGDTENNSGDVLAALRPLQAAMAEGIAILVVCHERKSGGDASDAGRGSSAFGGAADIVLTIRKGSSRDTARSILGLSRFSETPTELVIELTAEGYQSRGTRSDLVKADAEEAILSIAPSSEAEALTIDQLVSETAFGRSAVQRGLDSLGERIRKGGSGRRNDPYRYWAPQMLSAQTTSLTGQKESNGNGGEGEMKTAGGKKASGGQRHHRTAS
jgi:hypothetical protein